MPVEAEMLCEVWEEERSAPCTSSELYYLEPVGIGTPMVESLTSYISRLAHAHSVLLRTLITDEILPNLIRTHLYHKGQPVYDHLTTFWKRSAMLNGTCSTASKWVQALEQLTLRNDLRFLTMLTFENILSRRELMRPTQAWCPICYEEWRKKGQKIYQPLIWQLSIIRNCPQHQTLLHLRCPYNGCGRPLSPLTPRFQPGYCTHCERWLGNPLNSKNQRRFNRNEQEWQIWVENAVGDMLSSANKLINNPFQDIISAIISAHVYKTMEGNFSEFARRIQIHRRTAWEWAQGTQIPQLYALLRICSYFGTTPIQLFTGDFQEVAPALQNSSKKKSTSEHPHRPFKRFEAEKLQDVLEQVLQSEEYPPPSMREVAQRLHYDQSHLRKHFRCLCQGISARYKAYQQAQRKERIRKMNAQVQQTAEVLSVQGRSSSERQIGKMLGKRGIFKEDAARAALKNFLIH